MKSYFSPNERHWPFSELKKKRWLGLWFTLTNQMKISSVSLGVECCTRFRELNRNTLGPNLGKVGSSLLWFRIVAHLAVVVLEADADPNPSKLDFVGLKVERRRWYPMFVEKWNFKYSSWSFSRSNKNNGASWIENLAPEFRLSQAAWILTPQAASWTCHLSVLFPSFHLPAAAWQNPTYP